MVHPKEKLLVVHMELSEESKKLYMKAGKIASEVREFSKKLVKPGANILGIAEKLESLIIEKGGKPAWPVNISINEIAAHYTPIAKEKCILTENDIVKVDVGVHINGHIADTAATISINPEFIKLAEAAENALKKAIKIAIPGTRIGDIGALIQETIESYGYRPVSNLTGHGIEFYEIHASPAIPNVRIDSKEILKENQIIAIEPFATNGSGSIKESGICTIFQFAQQRGSRTLYTKKIAELAEKKFETLPFASRWITELKEPILSMAINQSIQNGSILRHPVLKEIGNGMVSQFEHTILVRQKPIVTTL